MALKGIKLVTFDATNTLLKFRIPPWEFYATVARDYGFKGTGHDLKQRMLDNLQVMSRKFPNFGRDTIKWHEWWRRVVKATFHGQLPPFITNLDSLADHLIDEFKTTKCWTCAEGGDDLLRILKNRQITIGVISNFDPRLHDILQNTNLSKSLDFVSTSYEIGFSKPDIRIFKDALDKCKLRVKPSESLHVGDDVRKDYMGARTSGWHALIVANDLDTETPPASQHVFKSLDKLALAIDKNQLVLS